MPPTAILRLLNSALFRLTRRLAVAALLLIVALYCGLRTYTVYLTHRAVRLLNEATRMQIGASEASILPFVAHYGAVKRVPGPIDDCPVKTDTGCLYTLPQPREELEYRNAHRPDYTYEIECSPFNVFAALHQELKGVHLAFAYLMFRTPIALRNLISLRDWRAFTYVSIRGGRVEGVSSGLWVEGSTDWLGHSWHLSGEIFPRSIPQETYSAEEGWLELNTTGNSTDQSITPAATGEQINAAQSINTNCLTGLIPCSSLHDLSPHAFEYKKRHPESDSNLD